MTKISSKTAYPKKKPISSDYFVGTDSEDFNKTVNFGFEEVAGLVNKLNGTPLLNYLFSTSPYLSTEVLLEGRFLSDENELSTPSLTKLHVNKFNNSGDNLAELYLFLQTNATDFYLKIRNSNNQNNAVYFDISSIEDFTDYFILNISIFKENEFLPLLENLNVYFFDFELKATSAGTSDPLKLDKSTYTGNAADLDERIDALESQTPGDYVKIVYVNTLSPNTATIFSEVTPPVVDNPSLREDTDNLYIGTDLGNWLWNPTTLIYGTKLIPNASNFKLIPSGIDAGSNKTSDITREGSITTEKFLSSGLGHFVNRNGSNTPQIGGFFAFLNAIGSGGNMFQLNASNGIDLWNYASSAWTKRFSFSSSGTITATAASLSNEVVVKSQLDLKVDKDGTKVLSDVNFSTALSNKLASIDATHYLAPLQTTVQLSALPQATISDKARVYVENDLSDYFYDATASSGDIAPDDQTGGIGFWRKVAVDGETAVSIMTKYESNADRNAFTNALKAKLDSITEIFTTALKSSYDGVVSGYTALIATGSRLITTGEITKLTNTSGTNSGDNATNTQYSALSTSKQDTLGFTPENVANKSDSYTSSSSTTYASTKALVDGLAVKNWIKSNESLSLAQRKGDVLYGILDQYTGEEITLSKVTGTPTVDGVVIFQLGSEYFERNCDFFNIEWFGAKGDNSTDNTDILQAIVLNQNVSKNIVIPAGIFKTKMVFLDENTNIVGLSRDNSIVKLIITGSKNVIFQVGVNQKNISVSNITLDANTTDISQSAECFHMEGFYNSGLDNGLENYLFKDINFKNSSSADINIRGFYGKIKKIKIEGCFFSNSLSVHLILQSVEDLTILNSTFESWGVANSNSNCIDFPPSYVDEFGHASDTIGENRNVVISKCIFKNTFATNFSIEGFNSYFVNGKIINNTFDTYNSLAGGIGLSLCPINSLFEGNTFTNGRDLAMELFTPNTDDSFVKNCNSIISNNNIVNGLIGITGLDNLIISNNQIKNNGVALNLPALFLNGAYQNTKTKNVSITGNIIDIVGQSGNAAGIVLGSNSVYSGYSSDISIKNNVFRRDSKNTCGYIQANNSTSQIMDGISISENTFLDTELVSASAIIFKNDSIAAAVTNNDFRSVDLAVNDYTNVVAFGNVFSDSGEFFTAKSISLSISPTPSAGTYEFLTRNTVAGSDLGKVEKLTSVTSAMVGLGNVDNTSDANKPVSTATQTELGLKENVANKSNSYITSSTTTYPNTKALVDGLDTKANIDGTILYHSLKWFIPSSTVSNSGTTVTSVGTQFLATMVGSKLTISGESRIITAFTSTTQVIVASAYSINYSGVVAGSWGVYSKSFANLDGIFRNVSYGTDGTKTIYTDNNNNYTSASAYSIFQKLEPQVDLHLNNSVPLRLSSTSQIQWSSTTNGEAGAKDAGLRRDSAGVLEIFDGITAGTQRDLKLRNLTISGTPTAPTATVGTNTTQLATTAFVQAAKPYKSYSAIINQTGTSAPTVTVVNNELSGSIIWTYSSAGGYVGTLTGAFTLNKTVVFFSNGQTSNGSFGAYPISVNAIGLFSGDNTGTGTDGKIWNASIEIKVYN